MTAHTMTNQATKMIPLKQMMIWVKARKVSSKLTQSKNRKNAKEITVHKIMMQMVTMVPRSSNKR